MRSVIIASVIFILLIILLISTVIYVEGFAHNISSELDDILDLINDDNWDLSYHSYISTKTKWDKYKKNLAMLFDHIELDNIQSSFSKLEQYIICHDKTGSLVEISVAKMLVEHLPKKDTITLDNLF